MSDVTTAAADMRQRYAASVAEIRADATLSDEGKRERIAELHESTGARLAGLREDHDRTVIEDLRRAERDLLGPGASDPATLIGFRDALDRSEKTTKPVEALLLLDRAVRTDDRALARATLTTALDRGWRNVVERYATEYPEDEEALQAVIAGRSTRSAPSAARRIQSSLTFGLPAPAELRRGSVR